MSSDKCLLSCGWSRTAAEYCLYLRHCCKKRQEQSQRELVTYVRWHESVVRQILAAKPEYSLCFEGWSRWRIFWVVLLLLFRTFRLISFSLWFSFRDHGEMVLTLKGTETQICLYCQWKPLSASSTESCFRWRWCHLESWRIWHLHGRVTGTINVRKLHRCYLTNTNVQCHVCLI